MLSLCRITISTRNHLNEFVRCFSKKSNNNIQQNCYKNVRTRRPIKHKKRLATLDPNFELLASNRGFPFILPGNVGLAWYDKSTSIQTPNEFLMEQIDENNSTDGQIICRIQTCPTVLRQTVCDLFPYRNLDTGELSVITITLRPDFKAMRKNHELETERMAQTFVLTAKVVCEKLKRGGYWADFINPFSGRPYLVPNANDELYETDEKFRCLDFQIFDIQQCKIISNEQNSLNKLFTGSLFTNAPSKKNHLNEIFIN